MKKILLLMVLALAGCVQAIPPQAPPKPSAQDMARVNEAVTRFENVLTRVEPVAEAECRRRTRGINCDYLIAVDDRVGQQPNAFQTQDKDGRPVIVFTVSLLLDVRNDDELALVTGHEAAHHILGHLQQTEDNAVMGAVLLGILGLPDVGAQIGARANAKEFEIQADRLGTIITQAAGFDPVRGLEYFTRIPDPGNVFLGTHPPHADRVATIRQTAGS